MGRAADNLALRKQVLLARSAMLRLKAVHEADAVRERLRWPRAVTAIAASSRGRSALFGLLMLLAGRGRLARLVGGAAAIVAVVKLAGLLRPSAAQPEPTSAASSQPPETAS